MHYSAQAQRPLTERRDLPRPDAVRIALHSAPFARACQLPVRPCQGQRNQVDTEHRCVLPRQHHTARGKTAGNRNQRRQYRARQQHLVGAACSGTQQGPHHHEREDRVVDITLLSLWQKPRRDKQRRDAGDAAQAHTHREARHGMRAARLVDQAALAACFDP